MSSMEVLAFCSIKDETYSRYDRETREYVERTANF